ncbi:MAG: hypothetical protein GXN92_02525 [Candidatus Micrarchaeota archaeon]|nr:hypothetical protein [Candidatus Micrarchaeota archaeon]
MREYILAFLLGLVIGLIIGIMGQSQAPSTDILYIYGPFKIVDGDTVQKVYRDKYMDTPELRTAKESQLSLINNSSCLKYYASLAKNYTAQYLSVVEPLGSPDRYDRELAIFYSTTGGILALEMVEKGLSFCYYRSPVDEISAQCLTLEERARENKVGMWSCK